MMTTIMMMMMIRRVLFGCSADYIQGSHVRGTGKWQPCIPFFVISFLFFFFIIVIILWYYRTRTRVCLSQTLSR